MLRLFRLFEVGRNPDGTPLQIPQDLLDAEQATNAANTVDIAESWKLSEKDHRAMRRRVVITGIGCINPMGHDVETVWAGLKEGKSGVDRTTIFDAAGFIGVS